MPKDEMQIHRRRRLHQCRLQGVEDYRAMLAEPLCLAGQHLSRPSATLHDYDNHDNDYHNYDDDDHNDDNHDDDHDN